MEDPEFDSDDCEEDKDGYVELAKRLMLVEEATKIAKDAMRKCLEELDELMTLQKAQGRQFSYEAKDVELHIHHKYIVEIERDCLHEGACKYKQPKEEARNNDTSEGCENPATTEHDESIGSSPPPEPSPGPSTANEEEDLESGTDSDIPEEDKDGYVEFAKRLMLVEKATKIAKDAMRKCLEELDELMQLQKAQGRQFSYEAKDIEFHIHHKYIVEIERDCLHEGECKYKQPKEAAGGDDESEGCNNPAKTVHDEAIDPSS